MKLKSSALFLAPLCLVSVARAQDAQAAAQDALPSAREVIDRFVEVTKLRPLLEKTKSMHQVGTFEMKSMGLSGKAESWSAKPDLRYETVEMGGFGQTLSGYDGKVGWMSTSLTGALILDGTDLMLSRLEADYSTLLKPESAYESMRTVGHATFEGKDCYELELVARLPAGMDAEKSRAVRTMQEYYEVATGLEIGRKGRHDGQLGKGPFEIVYADYKDFGGALLSARNLVRGQGVEIAMSYDTIEFDTATAANFALPKDVQAKLAPKPPPAPKAESKPQ